MDLGAINYLHWGKPKVWIIIAGENAMKLEKTITEIVKNLPGDSDQYKQCQNIMRHKEFLVTPDFLNKNNIIHTVIVQKPNEFIVTFPRGYHFGWNLGLNMAEATNYGNKDWIPFGIKAKQCTCNWFEENNGNKLVFPMTPFL